MSEKDMLDPFVKQALDENEASYGEEVRERWGEAQYRESQEKLAKLSKEEFEALLAEGTRLYEELAACMRAGLAPENDAAQEIVEKHFAYLRNFGDFYTFEVYANLGRMYEMDARFAKTFNDIEEGLAHYFAEAIEHFCVAHS